MRPTLAVLALMFTVLAQPALAMCQLKPSQVLSFVPYFGTRMISVGKQDDGSITFRHIDDGRMVANFFMEAADPVGAVSRSTHVARLDEYAGLLVGKAERKNRWAEKSVFPYDPVAWRTIEETVVDGVGEALSGHMEIRLTPDCILAADFISPSSQNLRSRWIQMATEIAGIRDAAASIVVPERWEPEDTTPTGVKAVLVGFGSPLAVICLIYLLLGHLKRLDPPGVGTRIVQGSAAAVAFGTIAFQFHVYAESFFALRYIDNMVLLIFAGSTALAGAFLAQRASLLGLVSSGIAGVALVVASFLRWTPDTNIGFAVGVSLIIMGSFGLYAWSAGTSRSASTNHTKPS